MKHIINHVPLVSSCAQLQPEIVSAFHSLLVAGSAQPLALLSCKIFFICKRYGLSRSNAATQLQFQRHKKSLCLNHGHKLLFKILNVVLITQKQVLKMYVTVIEAEPVTFVLDLSQNQGL